MKKTSLRVGFLLVLIALLLGALYQLGGGSAFTVDAAQVRPTLENLKPDGSLYTPSTQSLLRTHSWLESVKTLSMEIDESLDATVELDAPGSDRYLTVHNLPARYLVPRLHYRPQNPPDAMDALNLMLAEYSRNSVSVPRGQEGDTMAHYRTNLQATVPWTLAGDYEFVPNPDYRPLRFSVVNNCLAPGLWELSAVDRSGEIYHGWFGMPEDVYFPLVAEVNDLPAEFVEQSLRWSDAEVEIDLGRLRRVEKTFGERPVTLVDEEISFSSQGSRRKLHKGYVRYEDDGELRDPKRLSDLQKHPVKMTSFVEPGLYSAQDEDRTEFDFAFLAQPASAELRLVNPKTDYAFDRRRSAADDGRQYLEFDLAFANGERIVIGNLPLDLLVRQQDFSLHGFGVGILSASEPAERRAFLMDRGPRPSFAYLASGEGERPRALNSHGRGLEQVFIRSLPEAATPHFTITLSSYERIVDIVKLKVDMPQELVATQKRHSDAYNPPIFLTYQDNNVN